MKNGHEDENAAMPAPMIPKFFRSLQAFGPLVKGDSLIFFPVKVTMRSRKTDEVSETS